MQPRAEPEPTRHRQLGRHGRPRSGTLLVAAVWVLCGLAAALLQVLPLAAAWLLATGVVQWSREGSPIRSLLLWVIPVGAAMSAALVMPEPLRGNALVGLAFVALAFIVLDPLQRRWIAVTSERKPDMSEIPAYAAALRAGLAPVNGALPNFMEAIDATRLRHEVARARAAIADVAIPADDPWLAVREEAVRWLEQLDGICDQDRLTLGALLSVNRRGRRLDVLQREAVAASATRRP